MDCKRDLNMYIEAGKHIDVANNNQTCIKMLIAEAQAVPLLSSDDEREIFNRRDESCSLYMYELARQRAGPRAGGKSIIDAIIAYSPLSADRIYAIEDEKGNTLPSEWEAKVKAEKEAYIRLRNHVVEANMRLVISMVSWSANSTKKALVYIPSGQDPIDAMSEGMLGVGIAFDKFNINRGLKFSTYAVTWAMQSMRRWLAKEYNGNIRIPIHMVERIMAINKAISAIEAETGHRYSDCPDYFVRLICDHLDARFSLEEIQDGIAVRATLGQKSIDAPAYMNMSAGELLGEQSEACLKDVIPFEGEPEAYEQAEANELEVIIGDLLVSGMLTSRESRIVSMRFGFNGHASHTLQEISESFDVTRERIRQILGDALEKLAPALKGVADYA